MSKSKALKSSASALWSLIFGIVSIGGCWIFASIPAIILGCIALGKTGGPNPERSGRGMAKTGILTGCIGIVIGIFSMGIWLVALDPGESGTHQRDDAQSIEAGLHEIGTALKLYSLTEGTYPKSLDPLVPLYLPNQNSLAPGGNAYDEKNRYRYRPDGFRSEDPANSPVVMTPAPVSGNDYRVLYADGVVKSTSDPAVIGLFE